MIRSRLRSRSYGANGAVAAALPAMSPLNTAEVSGNIFDITSVSLPNADWSIGGWFRPRAGETNRGQIFALGASPNFVQCEYDPNNGILRFGGQDIAGTNFIGSHSATGAFASTANSVVSNYPIQRGQDAYIVFQRSGTKNQIWIKFNGHAPILAGEETVTSFNGVASQTFRFGRQLSGSAPTSGNYRDWFKLSYALTKDQIDKAGNGTDPTTFGTPAADDFYVPCDVNGTWVGRINSKNATKTAGNATITTGLGYAPMTNAVFIDPVGSEGFVFQQVGGTSAVALSGTYQGSGGTDIEIQFLNESNSAFMGWVTVATSVSGGVWSGTVVVPKGKRWIKCQLRKKSTPTEVMTSTLRWGVGENVILNGQSLMDYLRQSGFPYGVSSRSWSNYASTHFSIPTVIAAANAEKLTVTGASNSGGLIQLTVANHGRKTGDKITVTAVGGTTEANDRVWIITVTGQNTFTLDGSTFVNAYTSGGSIYIGNIYNQVPANDTLFFKPDGMITIANTIVDATNSVVCLVNKAVSGTSISNHYNWNQTTAPYTLLSGHAMKRVGTMAWAQGHNDLGLSPIRSYFADAGVEGAWTGWGLLGTMYDFYKTNWPNSDFKLGVVPFNTVTGVTGYAASIYQSFRWGMKDWCTRKIANGETNVFEMGWVHDLQPQLENNGIGAHLTPELKGTSSMAARIGQDVAVKLAGSGNNSFGPYMTTATRSGAVITLPITHNGGTTLRVLQSGATPSGFQVATDTGFTSLLTISNVTFTANQIQITLSADPAATVYVRYMYGFVSNSTAAGNITPLVTGVASNGSGLIRVSTVTTPTTATIPTGYQRVGGHGLTTGQWVRISGVKGATQANGYWQVTVIDSVTFDLVGSTDVGLGTFATGTLWGGSGGGGTAVVETNVAIPIYDDRTIGTYDTNGAPLQPIFTYITAT